MRRSLVRGVVVFGLLLTLSVSLAHSQPPPPQPFTWEKYKGKDGKDYNDPRWYDAGNNKRTLYAATGILKYPENPPITKVVFKVYKAGPVPGSWSTTPSISFQMNPAPTYSGVAMGWPLVGHDDNSVQFTEGEQIKVVWEIRTTSGGMNQDSTVELFVTVNYHEF